MPFILASILLAVLFTQAAPIRRQASDSEILVLNERRSIQYSHKILKRSFIVCRRA
jgi:hypothetical protein